MPTITNWLSGIDISFLNLNINGKVTQVKDIGVNILKSIVDDEALNSNPTLMSLAQNMPTMILNVLFFVLFFWLTKWVFWPLWAILSSKFFNKQKRDKKKYIKQQKKAGKNRQEIELEMPASLKVKQPKYALLGGLIGIFVGLLITAVTFMPFIGVNSIYQYAYANIKATEGGEEKPYLSTIINDDASKYINCFQDSVGLKIITYSGAGIVANTAFNNLAVVNVNGTNVYLNKEIETGVKVYNQVMAITEIDFENLTKENISTIIDAARNILSLTDNSQMINLIGDNVVPYLLDGFVDKDDFTLVDDGGRVDGLIKETYGEYEFSVRDVKDQLNHILNIISELNSNNLIIAFKDNVDEMSFEKAVEIIAENVNNVTKFVDNVFNNLFEVGFIGSKYGRIFDEATRAIFNAVDGIEYTEQTLNNEQVKNGIKTIFSKLINFCKYYNNHKDFDFGSDTANVLKDVGEIFDTVKTAFISQDNYNTLINFAKTKLEDLVEDGLDIENIDSVIDDLSSVTSWKTELSYLADLYKVGVRIYNEMPSLEDLTQENNTLLKQIGAALDKAVDMPGVSGSKIISDQNIRAVLEALITYGNFEQLNDVLDIVVKDGVTVKQSILDNIWNTTTNTTNVDKWETEFENIKNVLKIDFGEGDISLDKAGEVADYITKSKIFTAEILNAIVFDYVDDGLPEDLKTLKAVKDLKTNIKNNSSEEGFSYKTEFANFEKIVDALDAEYEPDANNTREEKKLIALGKAFDEILKSNSMVITKDVVNGLIEHFVDDYVDDMTIDNGLKTIVLKMKNNLSSIDSYEAEFKDIFKLSSIVSSGSATLTQIGAKLDEIVATTPTHNASKLITKSLISELIVYYIDDKVDATEVAANGLTSVVESIKTNASTKTIVSYATEFTHLQNLADLVSTNDLQLSSAGAVLDEICNTANNPSKTASVLVDRIAVDNMIKILIDKQIDSNSATLGNKNTTGTLANKLLALKNNVSSITNFATEFGYLNDLIDTVKFNYVDDDPLGKTAGQKKLEAVGAQLDLICNTANDSSKTASVLIDRTTVNNLIKSFFEEEIDNNLSTLGNRNTAGTLANKLLALEDNVGDITSFATEFGHLNGLISTINATYGTDQEKLEAIGQKFDDIKSANSNFIQTDNVNDIILYYFDDKTNTYTSGDYATCISSIRNKVQSATNYKTMFEELNAITTNIDSVSGISSASDFASSSIDGTTFDNMAEFTQACDTDLTHDIVKVMLKNVFGYNDTTHEYNSCNNVINNNYYFDSYSTISHTYPNYEGTAYYAELISALKAAI